MTDLSAMLRAGLGRKRRDPADVLRRRSERIYEIMWRIQCWAEGHDLAFDYWAYKNRSTRVARSVSTEREPPSQR